MTITDELTAVIAALRRLDLEIQAADAELQATQTAVERGRVAHAAQLAAAQSALEREQAAGQQGEQARRQLVEQLLAAQEEERRRLAAELHDQLGQDLTALILGLDALRPADEGQARRIAQLQDLAAQIGQSVRGLAFQLRPPALDTLGLAGAVEHYLDRWSHTAGVRVDFTCLGLERRLPPPIESALYRLVQESLTNVARHARAGLVSLVLEQRAAEVRLIVEDDGAGFDLDATLGQGPPEVRLGLTGMQERVAQLGGALQIETAPGRGTSLFVQIPLTYACERSGDEQAAHLAGR